MATRISKIEIFTFSSANAMRRESTPCAGSVALATVDLPTLAVDRPTDDHICMHASWLRELLVREDALSTSQTARSSNRFHSHSDRDFVCRSSHKLTGDLPQHSTATKQNAFYFSGNESLFWCGASWIAYLKQFLLHSGEHVAVEALWRHMGNTC